MAAIAYVRARNLISLINQADPSGKFFASIVDANIGLGTDPLNPSVLIDLSKEMVVPINSIEISGHTREQNQVPTSSQIISTIRTSGRYWFELDGRKIECSSMKQVLMEALEAIEAKYPGTLAKLSMQGKRTRRIVSKNRDDLFDAKHLVLDYSEKLKNGWWVGTNNSARDIESWLQLACQCANLEWGKKFKLSLA